MREEKFLVKYGDAALLHTKRFHHPLAFWSTLMTDVLVLHRRRMVDA